MGVFSYLNLKRPASFIWKALSPSREFDEERTLPNYEYERGRTSENFRGELKPSENVDGRQTSIDYVVVTDLDKSEFARSRKYCDGEFDSNVVIADKGFEVIESRGSCSVSFLNHL